METHDMMDLAAVKETGKSAICRTEGGSSYEEPKPYWPVGGLFHLFDAVCPPVFLGRISGTERTAICLAAFRFCRPCFLPAVVVMPAGKCPMDPLAPLLYPVPCGPGRSGLLLRVCGQRLGHFGGRYIAPAAGCAVGWLTYGGKLPRRLGTAGLVILLAVYVRLKVMGGPFGDFEFMDLRAIVVLGMGIWLLLRKEGRIKRKE